MEQSPKILLTGATGYIGGRLLKVLQAQQTPVRCLARQPEYLRHEIQGSTEVIAGDVLKPETLVPALTGIHTAFYLIHALGSNRTFETQEAQGAENFARAAKEAGVKKIIYLGGLGNPDTELSPHLKSRHQVGEVLRSSGIPVLEFRASIILGSGSLSFEMVRALTERLPIMVTPQWVRTPAQPIAVEDVLRYLKAGLELDLSESRIYEIGGADVVSYREIMKEYARQRGLKRWMMPVPVLTPWLSSLWLNLVTPIYARIGRKLIESLRNPTFVHNNQALQDFEIQPMGLKEAIARALKKEDEEFVQTHWSDSLSSVGRTRQWGGVRFKNRLVDSRAIPVHATAEAAFAPIQRIGGHTGWYYANWLWRLRGFLDRLVGGVGLRRGRRDPVHLSQGDSLDFWRVEVFEPPQKLLLQAEMKLPGRAWLEFEVETKTSQDKREVCEIRQTAIFDPIGLGGLLYWYLLYPLHRMIFAGMLRNLVKQIPPPPNSRSKLSSKLKVAKVS